MVFGMDTELTNKACIVYIKAKKSKTPPQAKLTKVLKVQSQWAMITYEQRNETDRTLHRRTGKTTFSFPIPESSRLGGRTFSIGSFLTSLCVEDVYGENTTRSRNKRDFTQGCGERREKFLGKLNE